MLEEGHAAESVCGSVLQNERSERHVKTKQTETLKVNMKDDNRVNRTISNQGPSWASPKSSSLFIRVSHTGPLFLKNKSQSPWASPAAPPEGRQLHVLRLEKMKMGLGRVSLLENKRAL